MTGCQPGHLLRSHLLVKTYQVCDDVVALLFEPHQNTGCVQSSAVGQNHSSFRHNELFQSQQTKKLQNAKKKKKTRNESKKKFLKG